MRQAVARAFSSPAGRGQAWTSREVGDALIAMGWVRSIGRSERLALQYALGNMVVAGELVRCGTKRVPGVKRPVPLYAMPTPTDPIDPAESLSQVLGVWVR
jgi:hypothetical protein